METLYDRVVTNNPNRKRRDRRYMEYNKMLLADILIEKELEKMDIEPVPLPKFNADGTVIEEDWMKKPQEDFTAGQERAYTTIRKRAIKMAKKAARRIKPGICLSHTEAERRLACL